MTAAIRINALSKTFDNGHRALSRIDLCVLPGEGPARGDQGKVREFFYAYGQGGQQEKDALMKLSKLSGFQQSSNRQLVPIRQLELYREKTKLQADTAMSEAEKKAKLAELDRRLAELNQQLAQK